MTLSAQITDAGIVAPSYADVLTGLQDLYKGIYGANIYIAPDSQDGQFLALLATAIHDNNDMAVAVFNAFSPSYALGAHLSSLVKINGLARQASSHSTAVGNLVGQVGTVITGGVVKDANGNAWDVPTTTIPSAGTIAVTVTAQQAGAIAAPSGSINKISTPVLGWQSFTSTADAVPGAAVELDAALRRRQAVSTQQTALGPLDAMFAALSNLPGVQRVAVYQNDTAAADANGLVARSIAVVIAGGTVAAIAQCIGQKKPPGCNTNGTTTQAYTDPVTGIAYSIKFYILGSSTIKVSIAATVNSSYVSNTTTAIKQAIVDAINAKKIGQTVEYSRLWAPAYLNGDPAASTYKITSLQTALGAGSLGTADIAIPFNSAAVCTLADVTLTLS